MQSGAKAVGKRWHQRGKPSRAAAASDESRSLPLLSIDQHHHGALSISLSASRKKNQETRDSRPDSGPSSLLYLLSDALTGDNATSCVVYVGRGLLRGRRGRGEGGRPLLIGSDSGPGCLGDRPRRRGPPPSSSEHAAAAFSRRRGRARARRERGNGAPGSCAARLLLLRDKGEGE